MNKLFYVVLTSLLSIAMMSAQKSVTGLISDSDGEPLIGANILIKGSGEGTITDIDGRYSLMATPGDVLEVSYTGYNSKEMIVGEASVMDLTMNFDAVGLEDIIVVGYAPQRRKDLTGSVSSVKTEDIEDVQLPSLETALQGRISGVQVTKNSGKPGGGINVNVRGRTSISASNQPLYVIDGVPIVSGDNLDFSREGTGGSGISVLSDINPDQIESIEVLKDAASAAIYGSRAANGVVLITTKSGSKSGTKITLNASYGPQWLPKKIATVDGPTYIEYITQVFGANIVGTEANSKWQDEIFQTGAVQEYTGSISGGNESTQYYGTLGFTDDEGIMVNSGFNRYSGRLNVNHIATEKLGFKMNMGYTNSNTRQIQNDNNIFGALSTAILLPPVVPIRNEDGSYGSAFGLENPVAAVTEYKNNINRGRLIGNVAATYNILDNLSFKASLGTDLINQSENVFEPRLLQSSNNGRAVVAAITDYRIIHDYVLSFNDNIGRGSLSVLAGTSFQEDKINVTYSEAVNFPTDAFTGLSSGAEPVTTAGFFDGDNLKSYFGSFNYNFDDRYYVTGTFRADGSSRFVNNQWGYFPGLALAWNISNESFLEDGPFDLFKIRASYGQTGNSTIGNFLSRQLYGGGENYLDSPGTAPSQIGNPDLKWETTTQTNIGLDFGLFKNRFSGSVDYYVKNTTDLLLDRPIPTTSGFTTVVQNVGEVQNQGIDLSLTGVFVESKNVSWSTTFNVGYLKNEIKKLVDGIPFDAGFANRIAEGQPIGSFFGHRTNGIFQNQGEIEAHATQATAAPGDIRFEDIGGGAGPDGILATADDIAPDGVINDDDRTYIGKALPDFTGGITNNINVFGVEVSAFFQFATGFQIFNNNLAFAEGLNSVFAPTVRAWENAWREEGDDTFIPRIASGDPNNNRRTSDRFTEDGDYIRLKTLTVGYNIPESILSNIGVSSLKVYASGYNLWTATGYSWFDPEVNIFDGNNTALGTDFLTFPQPRSIVFGVKVGL